MNDCNDEAIQNDVLITNDDEPGTSKGKFLDIPDHKKKIFKVLLITRL